MKLTKEQRKIVKILEDTSNKGLSYNEIVVKCSATKSEKSLYKAAISSLHELGVLVKTQKKYKLKDYHQDNSVIPREISPQLLEGVFDATSLSRNYSFAFVRTEKGDFYVSSEDTLNAYHNDKVGIEPYFRAGKPDRCIVRRIIDRANTRMAGDLRSSGNKLLFICSSPKIHNWFSILDTGGARENQKVVLEVTNWGNPKTSIAPSGKVIEILGDSGDPAVELMAVLRQFQLPLEFPSSVLDSLTSISDTIGEFELSKRKDYRGLLTYTVDPSSAKDFDDAISIQRINDGWRLYVHIADVAHYVKPDSPIFQEAVQRGNSFYFPKKVIPMLPEMLSNGVCSLRPDEDKLTMSVVTDFDGNGAILRQEMVESIIRSNIRLAYEQVDAFFESGLLELDSEIKTALTESRKLSSLLSRKRMDAGYIFFDLPEIEFHYDSEGFLHKMSLAEETESHKMIENFMLVANEYTAKKLAQVSPSVMYRIHEDPDWEKLEKLFETLGSYGIECSIRENPNKTVQGILHSLPNPDYHRVFDRIILRSMKKAKYTTEHQRHFGLAIEYYTHFTSPIRRLCDLVIHHLCKTYICKSQTFAFKPKQVAFYATVSSERELLADEAEREIERIYKLAYLKDKVGERFTGMVIGTNSSGLLVRLNEIPLTAVLRSSNFISRSFVYLDREMRFINKSTGYYYQLLDKVIVQIVEVSDDVYLEFAEEPDNHIHSVVKTIPKTNGGRISMSDKKKRHTAGKGIDVKTRSKKYASNKTKMKHGR